MDNIKINYILILLFFGYLSCNLYKNKNNQNNIDEINIYKLSQFSTYLTNVDCDMIEQKNRVRIFKITDKNKIKEYSNLFCSDNLLKDYNTPQKLDIRLKVIFLKKGIIIKSYCWSTIKKIECMGNIYNYNSLLHNFLLKEKLIMDWRKALPQK